ncbi:MAG TPA: hypothetical protein VEL76_16215 [Gemmataceae bacterium]|nr:hypothetical protein [Gemmataceae bacterium]
MRLNLTTDRTEKSSRTLPYVEAAKNLIRTVVKGDDGKRQVESFASLARRMSLPISISSVTL